MEEITNTGINAKNNCVNCGHEQPQEWGYCSVCGQKNNGGKKITVLSLLQSLTLVILNVENGFWRTLKDLSIRPHQVFKDYLAGNRVRYYDPWKYFLLLAGIGTIVYLNLGDLDQFAKKIVPTEQPFPQPQALFYSQWVAFIKKYLNLLVAVQIPFMAIASYLIFKKQQLTFAEHLVVNTYIFAQFSAIGAVFTLLDYCFGGNVYFSESVRILLAWGYSIYACTLFFSQGFTIAYFARALMWQFLGILLMIIVGGLTGGVLGALDVSFV